MTTESGHMFVKIDGVDWLLDTGAPTSFGASSMEIEGRDFDMPENYMGLSPDQLSGFVGRPTSGIIGADILNNFDVLIDTKNEQLTMSTEEIFQDGDVCEVNHFMGIPIVQVHISGVDRKMFFDTGAQISYFQDESLCTYPMAGLITDFFPGIGQFQTETNWVDVELGNSHYKLRCGSLPGLLGMTLMMAGVEGIIGNAILHDRVAGYFPRRQKLVLT
jgi:hypothetical protein